MKTDTKPTENTAESGNKSKPLLQAVFLLPYLAHKLTAKLSQQGIFNLDSEYPNENTHKIGYIDDFYFNDGEFSGSLKVTERTSFDFEDGDIDIVLRPLSDIDKDIDFEYTDNYGNIVKYPKKESVLGFLNIAKSDLITYHKILNAIRIPNAGGKGYHQYNFNVNGQLMLPFNIIQLLLQNKFDVYNLIGNYSNVISIHDVA